MSHYSGGLVGLVVNEEAARGHMKAVRSREESLDEMRRRRRNLGSQADNAERKLSKMGSEHKNLVAQTDQLNRLREEIRILDSEIMSEEARVSDFKRHAAKEWMTLKLGGLSELSSKGLVRPLCAGFDHCRECLDRSPVISGKR
jgi:polyhydroxyalkanoate synthesis regulator phasin